MYPGCIQDFESDWNVCLECQTLFNIKFLLIGTSFSVGTYWKIDGTQWKYF